MKLLILALRYLYPLSCVFLPCICYQVILYKRRAHHGKLAKGNLIWRYIFILYLFMVMTVVGMGTIWDISAYGLDISWAQINLIPFGSEGVTNYILNVVLFMPLGFLLPLIWIQYRTLSHTALAGFLFSLSIEIGQLFNHRVTDIDDLLMNTLGALIGFGIWRLFDARFETKPKEQSIFPDKPSLYLALTVLGTFFLDNWRWLVLLYR